MRPRTAELICAGSELLSFKSNSYVPLFAARLRGLGFRLSGEHTAPDDRDAIAALAAGALKSSDLVIICGGLGPTFDDLTRQGAAKALGRRRTVSAAARRKLQDRYGSAGPLPPNLSNQCVIVEGAELVDNDNGSAFGEVLTAGGKMLVLLPGPENEWVPMFDKKLEERIRGFFRTRAGTMRTERLKLAGLWEPQAEKALEPVMRRFPGTDCTILAGPYTAEFSFTVREKTPDEAAARLRSMRTACRKALGACIYGSGEETLAGALGALLLRKRRTLALAESCTGGAAADAITEIPGSSEYFLGGITAYSNEAKLKLLGVPSRIIETHGAVSGECAAAMAEGAERAFGSDYAAAVTGIAGPGGGTAEKPVGLVYFAVSGRGMRTRVFRRNFRHSRSYVKRCSVNFILDTLRKIIQ